MAVTFTKFTPGTRVEHDAFGRGTVVRGPKGFQFADLAHMTLVRVRFDNTLVGIDALPIFLKAV